LNKIITIFLVILVIEFLFKNYLGSNAIYGIASQIFGSGESTLDELQIRGGLFALQGFMREPAHFVESLFLIGLYSIFSCDCRLNRINSIIIMILSVLSLSLTGIMVFLTLLILFLFVHFKKYLIYFPIATILVAILPVINLDFIDYYMSRLINSFKVLFLNENLGLTSSEDIRLTSITNNLLLFNDRKLFGVGIGTAYSHSFLTTLLSNGGTILFIVWYRLHFSKITYKSQNILIVFLLIILYSLMGNFSIIYSYSFYIIVSKILIRGVKDENILIHNS